LQSKLLKSELAVHMKEDVVASHNYYLKLPKKVTNSNNNFISYSWDTFFQG